MHTEREKAEAQVPGPLGRGAVAMMAIAAGLTVANIYYNQPMLVRIATAFGVSGAAVGAVPTATQVGYALGLFFVVPLGDRIARRPLILILTVALVASLAAAAVASSLAMLVVASLAIGVFSTIAQQIVPLAAHLAAPERRGAIVGTVMSGLLIGVLGARVVAGFVATSLGWRAMFWLAALVTVGLALVLARTLPATQPTSTLSYPRLLRSLWQLFRDEPVLREASVEGGLLFGAFCAFWATLTLLLAGPSYGLGPRAAGAFGIVGIAGALAAPVVGRLADRGGPRRVVGIGIVCAIAAFGIFAVASRHIAGLVLGVLLLDIGIQAAQISNQSRIYALAPEARSRVNTVYMTMYFVGGAVGSGFASMAWTAAGWPAVVALGAGASITAFIVFSLSTPAKKLPQAPTKA